MIQQFLSGICVWLVVASTAYASEISSPRNVLFIAADDLNCSLGCYGDPMAKTPHLDRLAAEGVCFLRAYNQIPLCNPSRASVMTGMRPDHIKVYDLDRHFRDEVPDVVTLSQQFKNRGYYTARVGKIYHYNVPASIGTDGFDDPPSWMETFNPKGRDKDEEHLIINAEPHRKISAALSWLVAEGADEEQTDGMVATQAIEMLREHKDEPFFIAAGFFRPHTPYVAPKKYFQMYPLDEIRLPYAPPNDRVDIPVPAFAHNNPIPNYGLSEDVLLQAAQAYYASISFIDAQVGRLLDALDEFGLTKNTMVVFWSDHGYHLGEHGGVWQKRTLFEQGGRAPLLMRVPEAAGNGQACRKVVEFIDIYPTIIDWAGFPQPKHLDGRSLMPLIEEPSRDWRGFAVTQILRPDDDRLKTPVMGCSIRTDRWRYTEWANGEEGVELYDHLSDPMEFHNLAIEPDNRAKKVMDRLRPVLRKHASGAVPMTPFNPKRL
ncbi:sulfatase [Calycomorphotria hydatis]|uniref:Choline-sulfatase n=1 Tax=Calycomorphotria hydatis TaxID=2528027 RepID=A0A517TF87_9PLAN|nr:sulfatase [Calycomorphotria hydatis]QDT67035.1 Choline-sulfatase [Calycomorphotria hydatis]